MIEEIGRHVTQKVTFTTHSRFTRGGALRHAMTTFSEESVTADGVFRTAAEVDLKPGEVMAVWEISPDEHRPFAEMQDSLPPIPSRLLVRSADGKLLELNPAYLSINNRPDGYQEFSREERESYGLPI